MSKLERLCGCKISKCNERVGAVKETVVTWNDVKRCPSYSRFYSLSTESFEDNTCTVHCNDDYKLRGIHQLKIVCAENGIVNTNATVSSLSSIM